MTKEFLKKTIRYILGLLLCIGIILPAAYLYTSFSGGVLFFSAFIIAFLCSFAGLVFWIKKQKEPFETFLVFLTYFLFSASFLYFGPVTLDRSLSAFIYFYAVENGSISSDIYKNNDQYFEPYVKRRFTDAEKIGFLKCSSGVCFPSLKAKFLYYSLYPFGKLTKTLVNYDEFKIMMNERSSLQDI